ncbi:hypothetical protein ACFQL1_21265 [Halomicroarcula sp. GCM10025709]|uniref:hypothetical protein n=1 Tax=Halomicroarcula sp. GCM10025709 TaxID=3252669 RepID=UPI00361DE71E
METDDDAAATEFSTAGVADPASVPPSGSSFGRRFGVSLLLGLPGIGALVAYIYATTPPAAVPPGLSLPLLAVLSGVNPLLLLAVACLLGAYTAPRVGLRSAVIDRTAAGDGLRTRLRTEVGLAVAVGLLGSLLIVVLDAVMVPFVAQDLPQSAVGTPRPTVVGVLAYAPVRFLYGGITEELVLRFGLMSALAFTGWSVAGRRTGGPGRQ